MKASKGQRKHRQPKGRLCVRLTNETRRQITQNLRLARLEAGRRVTLDELLHRALANYSTQLRRRLRARGIDVDAVLAELQAGSKPVSPPFTGIPDKPTGRVYDHGPG